MDYTRLQTFRDCPERYKLRYLEQLSKIKDDAYDVPAKFGQAIHAGLEAYYTGKEVGKAFLSVYPECPDPNELGRTPANGLKLLEAYQAYYANQDKGYKILSTELVDSIEIGSYEPWEVKMDMVVEDANGIWGMDHKTTGKPLTEQYWRTFEPNSQISGYLYYLGKKYGQVSGMIVNGIKVGYRQRAYKGEVAGFHYEFQRQIFNRTHDQLEDWRVRTLATMRRMKELAVSWPVQWEKNEGQCGWCQYRELCVATGNEQVRDALYERGNSLEYLENKSHDG